MQEEQMDEHQGTPEEIRSEQEEYGRPRPGDLTLDDVTIERRLGDNVYRYTGAQIVRLIEATEKQPGEHEGYTDAVGIGLDLRGLAEVQGALSHVAHEGDYPISEALLYVSQQLHRLSGRVWALEPAAGNRKADWYKVEITKRLRTA
jgi:hypothetical protein